MIHNTAIVLVEPQSPGNIGMTCRAMKNMGLSRLRLVNGCDRFHPESLKFAVSAKALLENAELFPDLASAIADCTLTVGTTRRHGKYRQEILSPHTFLNILGRYLHLQVKHEEDALGRLKKKETMIFPRYHQLTCVRRLIGHAKAHGPGKNYLVQNSAGSGKSNSIAWLAYRLSSLHNAQDQRIFDSVIVVTDRRVLDNQLQNTIYQFEHKTGVVQKVDKDSAQLATAISYGTHIIITTLQKFPFVIDKIGDLPDRRYAVIIDEAHSSQGGEASKKLKEVLSSKSLETAVEDDAAEYDDEDEINAEV